MCERERESSSLQGRKSMINNTLSSTSHNHRSSAMGCNPSSSTRQLADTVITAARNSRKISTHAINIAQLRISNMNLHGRDDEVKLLRRKLRELAKKKDDDKLDAPQNNGQNDEENPNERSTNSNLILVSGTSGTGKSTLIHKGLGDPAAKYGYAFVSGKFDEKLLRPLSAFSDAMASLAKYIVVENDDKKGESSISTLIRDRIRYEFNEEDVEQLRRVLPGCAKLLGAQRPSLCSLSSGADAVLVSRASSSSLNHLAGKESISQIHYAIRRFLKIICLTLKGVILFIDDLQWSDTATLDLLNSIALDGEIPSILIVGAYREDEVPE